MDVDQPEDASVVRQACSWNLVQVLRAETLGSSDEPARHGLIADALNGDLYTAARQDNLRVVRTQQLPNRDEGTGGGREHP